jgi:hypothetical protein
MAIAALITWVVTALGGFVMLGTWIARGGLRPQQARHTKFPAPVVFGHFLLAAAGLVLWIIYLVVDADALAWAAFIVLLPVALLGFGLLARWLPTYRDTRARPATAGGPGTTAARDTAPAERHLPVPIVIGHGLLAVATVVLVLLTALGIGS